MNHFDARPLPTLDPDLDISRNHYWSYHSLPSLLACKKPLTASQDEDLFIAVHQICEIAFHQMILDLDRTLDAMKREDESEAVYFLDRVNALWRTVNTTMPILAGMRAFAQFRTSIGPTSGFQSVQFRRIEIMSGVATRYWAGGTNDASGKPHIAETEFDRLYGADIAAWLDKYATHSLATYAKPTLQSGTIDRLRAYEAAQASFHKLHINLAIVQLRRVGVEIGTGGTSFKDYLETYDRTVSPLFPALGL